MKLQLTLVTDENESLKLPDLNVTQIDVINTYGCFPETKIKIETDYDDIEISFDRTEDQEIELYTKVVEKLKANKNEL